MNDYKDLSSGALLFMKYIYPILTVVAGTGYLTALVFYGLTFYDVNSEELVIYWPLTFVMFGTWFAAVLKLRADTDLKELQRKREFNPLPMLKLMFRGTPVSLLVIAGLSFVFGMISFVVLMASQPGVVSIIDGRKVLHNHGDIIKELTDQEYRHAVAVEARKSLGHYLLFFGVGTAILYPKRKEQTICHDNG